MRIFGEILSVCTIIQTSNCTNLPIEKQEPMWYNIDKENTALCEQVWFDMIQHLFLGSPVSESGLQTSRPGPLRLLRATDEGSENPRGDTHLLRAGFIPPYDGKAVLFYVCGICSRIFYLSFNKEIRCCENDQRTYREKPGCGICRSHPE